VTEDGSLPLALGVALAFVVGLLLETRVLLRWRRDLYFLASFPIARRLVPIPHPPRRAGRTATVRWELSAPHMVRYWADPADRTALSGLHGVVILGMGRQGVELDVRWAPPWSPVIAAVWLAALGVVRGEGAMTVPIAAGILVALLVVYGERAHRVAAELRWSFVQGDGAGPDPASEPDAL
jgi:hypothetical protein